ncbi:hypothetical protein [Nocardia sp. NPDC051463]|uniref:hypothetical protein n=1 Tax=Nocardia sp. NPDC051463 TaxID=3154845 RepID=UPI00344EE19D
MPAASAATIVALRLARITALVLGSLLFLYACEFGADSGSTSWRVEMGIAAVLGIAGLGAGWFQITLAHHVGKHEFRIASEGRAVTARIVTSGNLVFHGHDLGGPHPEYEWTWTFRPTSFPAIRAALGGRGGRGGDLIALLEDTIPDLDRHGRHDPGAWLRHHDIPARYREKGVDPAHPTRKLPVIECDLPQPISLPRQQSAHRGKPSASHRDRPPTSHHSKQTPSLRDKPARSHRAPTAPSRHEVSQPPHKPPAQTHRERWSSTHDNQPPPVSRSRALPSRGGHQPPSRTWEKPTQTDRPNESARPRQPASAHRRRNEPPDTRRGT